MNIVTLLDTSVSSDNLGDQIIMDSVREELSNILPGCYIYTVASHDGMGRTARDIIRKSSFTIAGGTNFLSSSLFRGSNWKVGLLDLPVLRNVVLFGVGWRDYQRPPGLHVSAFYKRALSSDFCHSVRDSYTFHRVKALGKQVTNTSCPTMWQLTEEHCRSVSRTKSNAVLTTVTYYRADRENDAATLRLLRERYDKVFLWPQQAEDLAYAKSLGVPGFEVVDPNLSAYSSLLDSVEVDYVGSRLHGGIKALQKSRRSLIIAVDNRAAEINKDTGLPVVARHDLGAIARWIDEPRTLQIRLPNEQIAAWRRQFAHL